LRFWVSANPYQEGEFVCYDLKKVFVEAPGLKENRELKEADLTVPADSFLLSANWKNFLEWRELKQQIKKATVNRSLLNNERVAIKNFIQFNPEFWETYFYLAEYYKAKRDNSSAKRYFEIALSKEVNDKHEVERMQTELKALR